jgi:glycosyltransferase involved in cell wall biosynthesis
MIAAMPTVSIVVPVFNGRDYLIDVFSSIKHQVYSDFEVIFVDDGSTDGSLNELKRLSDDSLGFDIKIVQMNHKGLAAARNRGILASSGEYVSFLDCDDYWYPNKISTQIEAFSDPKIGAVFSKISYFDSELEFVNLRKNQEVIVDNPKSILDGEFIVFGGGSNILCRREILVACGGFDETLAFAEDLDLWLRVAALTQIKEIEICTVRIWIRSNSMQRKPNPIIQSRILQDRLRIYQKWLGILDEASIANLSKEFVDSSIDSVRKFRFLELILRTSIWLKFFIIWVFFSPKEVVYRSAKVCKFVLLGFRKRFGDFCAKIVHRRFPSAET